MYNELIKNPLPSEYNQVFGLIRLKQNIRRTRIMALLIVVLEFIVLSISFIPSTKSMYGEFRGLYQAFYMFIIVVSLQYYIVTSLVRNKIERLYNRLDKYLMVTGLLTLLGFMGGITLLDQHRGLPSFVYLFISISLAIVITVRPAKSILLYMTTHSLFLIGNHVFDLSPELIFSNYINMTSVMITVIVISMILHRHQIKDFLKEQKIKEQNVELSKITMLDPLSNLYNRRSWMSH